MDDEFLDFGNAHFAGMFFVVMKDEAANPVYISFFGAIGVVFGADGVADLFEEFFVCGFGDEFHIDLMILGEYNLLIQF